MPWGDAPDREWPVASAARHGGVALALIAAVQKRILRAPMGLSLRASGLADYKGKRVAIVARGGLVFSEG